MRLGGLTGRHRSTCWKVLARDGCSRRPRGERQTTRRYEWSQPGALLHIDAFSVSKFEAAGHWATGGERSQAQRSRGAGKTVVIGVVDDHTRLAYCELHAAENADNVAACLRRGAAWMHEQGCGPLEAVMSDNTKCYARSHDFTDALGDLDARHILPRPTPRAGTARSNAEDDGFGWPRRDGLKWPHLALLV